MPDLGKYAFEVGLAYAGSILLLAGLVLASFAAARRSRRRLTDAEARHGRG